VQRPIQLDRLVIASTEAILWLIGPATVGTELMAANSGGAAVPAIIYSEVAVYDGMRSAPIGSGIDVAFSVTNISAAPATFRAVWYGTAIWGVNA
jgi:hypothetical protein